MALSKNKEKPEIQKHDAKTAGKRSKFPVDIAPMLATIVDKPFDKEGWQYEIKWDGYRAIAFCNKNKVELKSRNDLSRF